MSCILYCASGSVTFHYGHKKRLTPIDGVGKPKKKNKKKNNKYTAKNSAEIRTNATHELQQEKAAADQINHSKAVDKKCTDSDTDTDTAAHAYRYGYILPFIAPLPVSYSHVFTLYHLSHFLLSLPAAVGAVIFLWLIWSRDGQGFRSAIIIIIVIISFFISLIRPFIVVFIRSSEMGKYLSLLVWSCRSC